MTAGRRGNFLLGINMIFSKSLKRIKPLKRRMGDVLNVLPRDAFRIAEGSDSGWFGDGMYILTSNNESLRIVRSGREEFLYVAFEECPDEEHWFGIAELMVAIGEITFEDAVSVPALPHELDAKLAAYLRIRPGFVSQQGLKPEVFERLQQLRQRSKDYVQERFGKRP